MERDVLDNDTEDAIEADPVDDDERFHDGEKGGRNEHEPFYGWKREIRIRRLRRRSS